MAVKRINATLINPRRAYKGRNSLRLKKNESMHYSIKADSQINLSILGVDEFLQDLKG